MTDPGTRVTFRQHAIPNELKSRTAGRPVYDDFEVCDISFAANKQTVGTFLATDFADWSDDEYGVRAPRTYAEKYREEYLAFKAGDARSLGGTPLEELPFLTQGKRLELKGCNVYTAEALASLDGAALKMIGMGGRDLKDKARAYLEAAAKGADAGYLKSELEKRDALIAQMQADIVAMANGGAPKPTDAPTASAFKDFEDEDIANWIKDADKAAVVDGLDRPALIAKADSILAEQGKKQKKAA